VRGGRRSRAALVVFAAACGVLAALLIATVALRQALRPPEERAADEAREAEEREETARQALAQAAAEFCHAEIAKRVRPLAARFDPSEERLGYEPIRGEAYVVGELAVREPGGADVSREYVCRLKRQGDSWLALVASVR
jgi:hypothetical protein